MIKLLYVDDDAANCAGFSDLIRTMSAPRCEVTIARSAEDARRQVDDGHFNVVFVADGLGRSAGGPSGEDVVLGIIAAGAKAPPVVMVAEGDVTCTDRRLLEAINGGMVEFLPRVRLNGLSVGKAVSRAGARTQRVLIVEDDPDDYELMVEMLAASPVYHFHCARAASLEEAERLMSVRVSDVYLIDWRLGTETSTELVVRLTEQSPTPTIVLITSAEKMDVDDALLDLVARQLVCFISKQGLNGGLLAQRILFQRELVREDDHFHY